MDGSILDDVKKQIGIYITNTDFDEALIMAINSVLFNMYQMGIVVPNYSISDSTTTWSSVLVNPENLAMDTLKTWVGLKVKMIFDPPTSSILAEAIRENLKEMEWRLYITENYVGEIQNGEPEKPKKDLW
jgi:hypothetical protein